MPTKLGILAGSGTLPAKLIERCREIGREVFVLAFEGQTPPELLIGVEHGWTRFGAADEAVTLLRNAGVTDLVFAGAMRRPPMSELRLDWRATKVMARVGMRALGDDGLLSAIRDELEREGFRLVGADDVLADLLAPDGVYGMHHPDEAGEVDIATGFRVVRALGALDIGQAAVVGGGVVLGVEAVEGTDALIDRCGVLMGSRRGILVKASKPGQERRIDLPTIGPDTVERAAQAGFRGIAVEAGRSLVLDRARVIERANELGLFVVGRRAEGDAPLFYLIAGEPSGDLIGAALMRALKAKLGGAVRFDGIGGEQMAAEGIVSRIPIRGLAIMGVVEVLPAWRRILRWVRETVADIQSKSPAAVITIDSSGFCFRVGERLKPLRKRPPIIHYVAPMVWAWRRHRTKYAARASDHLLTLFPFEPAYFSGVGLPATFVGHPVVESGADKGDGARFRERHGIAQDVPVLCMLPGSRKGEVGRLLPVFRAVADLLASRNPGLVVIMPTVETVADIVTAATRDWPVRVVVVRGPAEKFDAFAASAAALAASGTVVLELGMAGLPAVVTYRAWPPTAWVLWRVIKLPSVSLINILAGRAVMPELLQEYGTPEALAEAVGRLLNDPEARRIQREGFADALAKIGRDGELPSHKAADIVLSLMRR